MKKVKILKVPNMAYGGRVFNQVAPNALPYQTDEKKLQFNNTLQPVSREQANLEAEKDEEVVLPNYNGLSAKFRVGGKRHSEGGTPLNLPDDSFVFSDTRAMKIKDPNILKEFGKAPKKGGYTPAEIAKSYDINKYRKVLADPNSDSIQRDTAEQMIGNYNIILGKLALDQESIKGFPQGIPLIAEPYMMANNITAEDILPLRQQSNMPSEQEQMTSAKYGGVKKVRIKQLPKANFGLETDDNSQNILSASLNEGQMVDIQNPGSFDYSWDTGANKDLTFNSMVDSGFYDKPLEMGLKSEKTGIDTEVKIKEKDKSNRKYDFNTSQLIKKGITSVANSSARNQQDPMLAYRTMEDTMSGNPTSKGTFDPLNKNNFPYKNDYAVYDPFTTSVKYGGGLPKAQKGLGILRPEYLPTEDEEVAASMVSYLTPQNAANQQAAQNAAQVQAAQQVVSSQPATTAAPTTAKPKTTAKAPAAKSNSTSKTSSSKSSSDDLMSFNQSFWDEYGTLGQSGAFQYDVPGINFQDPKERERLSTQKVGRKGTNIYGDLDWDMGDPWADFSRRHQWYLKDHPNFDPAKKDVKNKNGDWVSSDVLDFQKEYCKRAAAYGMKSCYFIEGAGKGVDVDGKFGEHTWSAPGFNDPVKQEQKKEEQKKQDDIPVNTLQQPPIYNPYQYYPQDVLNLMTAMGTQIPDPETFYSNLAWQAYSPAYIKEDYSPIMEAANIATQGIGAYGSRQSADASYSGIQGKAARQAADHNLQVANLNVGIYNDAEKFNAQMRNANQIYNLQQKQQNFDTEQAYAADRLKSKNEKRANIAAMYNNMLTNAVDTYNMNIMSPHFKIHPSTGGMATFDQGLAMQPNRQSNLSPRVREYQSLIDLGYTHDQAIDIIGRQTGTAQYPSNDQQFYNPYNYMAGPIT